MILVSYIDILDYIRDDRQCLIEGEELFNENKVKNVSVCCRDIHNLFEVSALCACSNEPNSKECQISIEINQEDNKKGISSKCSCKSNRPSKCQHVAATLIHLHRYPPLQHQIDLSEKTVVSPPVNDLNEAIDKPGGRSIEHNTSRKLRSIRQTNITNISKKDDPRTVSTKQLSGTDDTIEDDPTWDKENDGDEDEAFDWTQSSDDEWEPIPEKKRKRDLQLLPAKDSKEKIRKKRNRMTKAEAEKKAKEITSTLQSGEDGNFLCCTCDYTFPKLNELHDHIRDIHFLKKEVFSCCKCDKTFRLLRMLKAHEGSCDVNCEENEGSVTEELQTVEVEEEEPELVVKIEPLQCLLCKVVTATRREMHDHYLTAHRGQEKDNVSVCDRCGEFRLPREHICPSQLSFQCHMCRGPFKAGRDYWNHLIRASKRHASMASPRAPAPRSRARWWCGWARCAERFPSEAELLAHARLHLPAHVQLMCGVCMLVLRTTDAKIVHMERHDAGVYECGVCRHACGDREALRQHWDTHARERPHRCDTCGWRFATSSALQVHVRKFHEGGPFCCAKCPQKFDDRTEVRIHFGAAHGKMRCPRPGCSYRCANKASLERHGTLAHRADAADGEDDDHDLDDPAPPPPPPPPPPADDEAAEHACAACGQAFPLWRALLAHARSAHAEAPPPTVACPDCGKAFRSPRDMAEHRRLHTGEKPFICAECGMTFKRAQNLEYHTKGAHKNERNFVCPECGKRFISNADMKRHLRYNHQNGMKTHLCPECGHKLTSLYKLKMHVQSRHTGERPHKCHLCDMGFVASSDLKKHVTFKHRKEHPFACGDCDKRYQRRRDLDVHRLRHHAGAQHRCPTCSKDFDSYASMTQHARYHTTEEPFQCAKCGRRFPHRMNLSRHLCTPDIKKNYHCASCGLSFTTSGSLKSHRRRLHAADQGVEQAPAAAKEAEAEAPQEAVVEAVQASLSQPEPEAAAQLPHHHQDLDHQLHNPTVATQDEQYQHHLQQAVEQQAPARQQHHHQHQHHEPMHHLDQGAVGQAWGCGPPPGPPPGPPAPGTTPALAGQEAILALTRCSTYTDPEAAAPQAAPSMHLLAAPELHTPAPAPALRYEAPPPPPPPTATLVVKSEAPPPLVSLHVKAATHHPHMMYGPAAPTGPASTPPAVKLVSVSQPPPLTSITSPSPSGAGAGGLILGAPIQTTADGSFHLVFVPHGAPAPGPGCGK